MKERSGPVVIIGYSGPDPEVSCFNDYAEPMMYRLVYVSTHKGWHGILLSVNEYQTAYIERPDGSFTWEHMTHVHYR